MLQSLFRKARPVSTKKAGYVYDKELALLIGVNSDPDATYCASPLIIREGFKFRDVMPDGTEVQRTVLKREDVKDGVIFTYSDPVPLHAAKAF